MEIFSQLQINIPFLRHWRKCLLMLKFMKELLTKKRKFNEEEEISLIERCSAIVKRKLPPKFKDLGSFTIPCNIGKVNIGKAPYDLDANINRMPLSMTQKLEGGECIPTRMSEHLTNRPIKRAYC